MIKCLIVTSSVTYEPGTSDFNPGIVNKDAVVYEYQIFHFVKNKLCNLSLIIALVAISYSNTRFIFLDNNIMTITHQIIFCILVIELYICIIPFFEARRQ